MSRILAKITRRKAVPIVVFLCLCCLIQISIQFGISFDILPKRMLLPIKPSFQEISTYNKKSLLTSTVLNASQSFPEKTAATNSVKIALLSTTVPGKPEDHMTINGDVSEQCGLDFTCTVDTIESIQSAALYDVVVFVDLVRAFYFTTSIAII